MDHEQLLKTIFNLIGLRHCDHDSFLIVSELIDSALKNRSSPKPQRPDAIAHRPKIMSDPLADAITLRLPVTSVRTTRCKNKTMPSSICQLAAISLYTVWHGALPAVGSFVFKQGSCNGVKDQKDILSSVTNHIKANGYGFYEYGLSGLVLTPLGRKAYQALRAGSLVVGRPSGILHRAIEIINKLRSAGCTVRMEDLFEALPDCDENTVRNLVHNKQIAKLLS